jgi:hypothetical protein
LVNRSLHSAEHRRDLLPLVEQHGLPVAGKGDIGVGADRGGFGRPIEVDDNRSTC